jgi:hypothetical protein
MAFKFPHHKEKLRPEQNDGHRADEIHFVLAI